ncbi:Coagulation factor VII [Papilio xuthus]|uniref:Coagulation factor VII n=1 Tax=Papilio xuthus TaxID=66420 RepID=A0A194PGR1_PAPXU|nr:Coagulation factor VII [Papilio xuthus]
MLTKLFIFYFTFKVIVAQINGEFWWLNDKLLKLYKVEPPQPKFEDIGEFETDESAKIVFRDDQFEVTQKEDTLSDTTVKTKDNEAIIHFRDESKLVNPVEVVNKTEAFETQNRIDTVGDIKKENENKEDVFNFVFPDDVATLKNVKNKNNTNIVNVYRSESFVNNGNKSETFNNIIFNNTEDSLSENICTYMKKSECNRCNGFPYLPEKQSNLLKTAMNIQNVCCILPLTKSKSSKIKFPSNDYNRIKRSNNDDNISPALKQRQNLIERKYGTQTTASTVAQKIVTPDEEYIDPYLNIKNYNFKQKVNEFKSSQEDNDYIYNDYYAAELPKPSLVGLYSDHSPPNWSFVYPKKESSYYNDDSVEEEIPTFGYSTIDPRQGSSSTAANLKPRLLKLTSASDRMLNLERHTVSYHSNPDFQVLQGFKLLNLKNKMQPHTIRTLRRPTTAESLTDSGEKMFQSESSIGEDYDDYTELTDPLYKNCGRTNEDNEHIFNCDSTMGESPRGAHPWLLLVTLSKRRQSILCYATLVHPRAAITTADCTYEMNGEITIVAGAWDLKEEKRGHLQYRKPSVRAHQQYTPGKLAYNIALLYWRRPLRLDFHVQPACLSDDTSNECIFVGWGGYDQGVRQRPRWQRASVLSSQNCAENMSNEQEFDLPIDTFCASVDSKTTVTGPGGPLLCRTNDVYSVAGLSVWRNHVVVLMRPQEWTIRAMAALRIN